MTKNHKKAVSVSHHTSLSLFIIWKGRSRSDYEPSIPRFNILGSFFECSPSHLHTRYLLPWNMPLHTFINPQIVQGTESLAWAVSLNDFQLFSSSTNFKILYLSHSSYFHNGNTSILAFSPPSLLKHFLHLATKLSSSFDFCPAVRQFFIFFECFSHMASQISFL